MFIAMLLGLQASAAALPEITIRTTSEGYRAEAADFPASQEAAVYDEISRRADKICVGKQVKWGRFGSSAKVRIEPSISTPSINGYFKEFRCVVEKPRASAPAPADWGPDPADEADVRRIFELYYRKRDAGDFAAAAAMWQPEQQLERSADDVGEINKRLAGGSRRITRVTWYVNPPSAEIPGVYAALDFVGDYPKLHIYCGYLILYRRGPGQYEITREEQNSFERGEGTADLNHVALMRAAVCRGD